MLTLRDNRTALLAVALTALAALYVFWKITQSPEQALQFTFNGLSVGAVYAILAIGFTIVYSTVWFFDLYYGAAAALGAYGVFYLRSQESLGGRYDVTDPIINTLFAVVVAGVVAWLLHETLLSRLRNRLGRSGAAGSLVVEGALAVAAGGYAWIVLSFPQHLHLTLSPAAGALAAVAVVWTTHRAYRGLFPNAGSMLPLAVGGIGGVALGAYIGLLLAGAPGAKLYLSWVVSCLVAGAVGLALYRGLYAYMRERARSPLVMLVSSLGILLALTAFTTIVFSSAPRPLPEAFGSAPWTIGGANIKGFNVFTIGVALISFVGLLALLKWTAFGKAARAIGDDEEVARVVGINTTVVIAIVFFIGAVLAALAGVLAGHDTAIQPRMGLLLLLKGWIASVVGGIGNIYGAIVGGFALGLIEQFGIWDLAGEWKDAIAFILLILFLSFWPQGILPRK